MPPLERVAELNRDEIKSSDSDPVLPDLDEFPVASSRELEELPVPNEVRSLLSEASCDRSPVLESEFQEVPKKKAPTSPRAQRP